jgi:hypothetical protein
MKCYVVYNYPEASYYSAVGMVRNGDLRAKFKRHELKFPWKKMVDYIKIVITGI